MKKLDEVIGSSSILSHYIETSIYNVETAIDFLYNIRNREDVLIKHVDLEDDLRNSEGSMSTVLDGNISKDGLLQEIHKRNPIKMTIFASVCNITVIFSISFIDYNIAII